MLLHTLNLHFCEKKEKKFYVQLWRNPGSSVSVAMGSRLDRPVALLLIHTLCSSMWYALNLLDLLCLHRFSCNGFQCRHFLIFHAHVLNGPCFLATNSAILCISLQQWGLRWIPHLHQGWPSSTASAVSVSQLLSSDSLLLTSRLSQAILVSSPIWSPSSFLYRFWI
jgi:hypothetical protein